MTISREWWAFERGTLWAAEVAEMPGPVARQTRLSFREVGLDAAGALAVAMGLPNTAEAAQRFTSVRRCYAAWDGEQIAAYGWVSRGSECVGELERTFHIAPDEAYIWDCVTLPAYRGRGIYSALLSYIRVELYDVGVRRIWIGASLDNQPSIKGFMNAGFRPAIKLIYGRLLGLRCAWVIGYPGAPRQLVAAARRVIIAADERMFGPLMVGIG